MEEKHKKEEQELPHRELENSLAPSGSYIGHPRHEGHGHSLTHHSVSQHGITVLPSQSNSPNPGIQAGISIDTYIPGLSVTIKPISNDVRSFTIASRRTFTICTTHVTERYVEMASSTSASWTNLVMTNSKYSTSNDFAIFGDTQSQDARPARGL